MNFRLFGALALGLAIVPTLAGTGAALTFTCETVARQGFADPAGALFTRKFEEPAVNGSGEVIFKGRTKGGPRALYFYPPGGPHERLAADDDPAPGGSTFRRFGRPSINDGGDLAFFGDLAVGQGIFIRESGGSLVDAVRGGDTSPAGGTFFTFDELSRISDDAAVAFIADVDLGPDGIFRYDTLLGTISTVALVGDTTLEGRQLCEFVNVELGDSEVAVFQATTKVACSDPGENPLAGIFRDTGAGIATVALEGDPTPIGGTTYLKFFETHMNAAGKVSFRAAPAGIGGMGIFLFDPVGTSTITLVRTGDAAPGTGTGTIKTIPQSELTDADQAAFRGRVIKGTTKHGIFLFDTNTQAVVLEIDPVPDDDWGPNATYRRINEDMGVDRSGANVVYSAKVRDNVSTPNGTGLFRCEGT